MAGGRRRAGAAAAFGLAVALAALAVAGGRTAPDAGAAATAGVAPRRVVSINLCTDQLLLLLADRAAVASVSFLAADPQLSFVADRIADLPLNAGQAEEILALEPDLVLAGRYAARHAVRLLTAHGVPVLEIDLADDFADIREQTLVVAAALGETDRGEALLAAMEAALAAAAPPPGARRPSAALYQANGFTAGAGTLADAVLTAAGFDNFAAEGGLVGYGYLPIEAVVWGRPDLLVIDEPEGGPPSLAQRLLRHRALDRLTRPMPQVGLPAGTLACGGPFTAAAVTALAAARRALEPAP